MAYFPCNVGPHYNPGKNYLVYPALAQGDEIVRKRLRLCAAHLHVVQDDLAQYEVLPEHATASRWDTGADCFSCRKPIDQNAWDFFVTAYPTKDERKDYWAKVHESCADATWVKIGLA